MTKPIQHQFHQDQLPQSKEPKQNNHSQNQTQHLHTANKYKKCTTSLKVGSIESVQIQLDSKDGLQTVAWKKNTPRSTPARLETKHPDQPLPDEYPSSEQHENNKTTLIVGGIVLGLTALII